MRAFFAVLLSLLSAVAQAQITYVGAGTPDVQFGAGTSQLDVPVPTNNDGDLLIIAGGRTDDVGTWNTPMGFTNVSECVVYEIAGDDHSLYVAYKIASSDSGTVALTHTDTASQGWGAVMFAYRGVDQMTPLDATSTTVSLGNTNDGDPSAITTTTANAMVVVIDMLRGFGADIIGATPSTNYTERIEYDDTNFAVYVEDRTITSAGAEDPGVIDSGGTDDGANDHILCTMALRAAGGSGGLSPLGGLLRGPIR